MADITKCNGGDCPVKESCYRFTAEASDYQYYFMGIPFKDGECEMYWGENSENIFNQLKDLLKNNNNESNRRI
jgi:hypothetical protein